MEGERERQEVADFYVAAREGVIRYLVASGLSADRAAEAAQEEFLKFYLARRNAEEIREPRSWVYRVARNIAIDGIRRDPAQSPLTEAVKEMVAKTEPAISQLNAGWDALRPFAPQRDDRDEFVMRMENAEAGRGAVRITSERPPWHGRSLWMSGAIAAGIAIALFLFPWGRGSEMRADTLLARAASSAVRKPSRLLVRTKTASFVRPAVFNGATDENSEESAIRGRFAATHYNWQDPLNAQSYSQWRHGLAHKSSRVIEGEAEQRIETKTTEGTLQEASLTLDVSLMPVSARFQFEDHEWVEITVAPDRPAAPASPVAAVRTQTIPSAEPPATSESPSVAERELSVRLAIDALNLGAGDPLEVSAEDDGVILVTTYGLTAPVEARLRTSLESISNVTLHSIAEATNARPVLGRAEAILRTSQDVSFEAHLLTRLDSRFAEAILSDVSKAKLFEMRRKHSAAMLRDLADLRQQLQAEHSAFLPLPTPGPARHQPIGQSATAMDRLITRVFTEQQERIPEATWRELEAEFGKLEGLAAAYDLNLGTKP